MIESILTQEKLLGKFRDESLSQMVIICFRADQIARYSLEENNLKSLLISPLPKVLGLLGEAFDVHLRACICFFLENEEFKAMCKRLNPKGGEQSLEIEFKKALLIPLRQSVGSCFATAFLIYLQKTDLLSLSKDLFKVMVKKSLSRVIHGLEIKIPLCPKVGQIEASGHLFASPLMKSYEFTTAGLADYEVGFSKWNFHIALGLDHEASGGIGKIIYNILDAKLKVSNEKLEIWKEDIDHLERSLDIDEASFRSASTIDRMQSIKRAASAKNRYLGKMVDDYEEEAKFTNKISVLYKFFVEQYLLLFPHYFQELYDPEIFGDGDIMEDKPAGFRLVYKHGRSDPKTWSYVTNDQEYIAFIKDFILSTEQILISLKRGEGLEKEIESIITQIMVALDSQLFLNEQKERIEQMHKKHLGEQNNILPYAYVAGGNFESYINTYLLKINPVEKERISAESPFDLCYHLIEFFKDSNKIDRNPYLNDPFAPLMVVNDTHAFNLLPGQKIFKEAWMNSANTYTYIRDTLMQETSPIVFADTNWGGKYLAFFPNKEKDNFNLVLYDGIAITLFTKWDIFFKNGAFWNIIVNV
jgi:hypothetical protein